MFFEYVAQPTKDKIFTFKDLDIDATPIQKIAFNYLLRLVQRGWTFFSWKGIPLNL